MWFYENKIGFVSPAIDDGFLITGYWRTGQGTGTLTIRLLIDDFWLRILLVHPTFGVTLLPLRGALTTSTYPGRCPGLCTAAPSGRKTICEYGCTTVNNPYNVRWDEMGIDRTHLLWSFTNLTFCRFYSYTPVNARASGYYHRHWMFTITFLPISFLISD